MAELVESGERSRVVVMLGGLSQGDVDDSADGEKREHLLRGLT